MRCKNLNRNDVWALGRLIRTAVHRKREIYIFIKTGEKRKRHNSRNERKDKRED